nr:hypothetical protein [Tanacetum cinerariifolium]
MYQSEEPKALYGVTSPNDYALTYSNNEMSHHTFYGVKCLHDYAETFKYTRDDVSDSALRRNICDRVMPNKKIKDRWIMGLVDAHPAGLWRCWHRQSCVWHTKEWKSHARLSKGHFIGCLAHYFGLVSDDGLRGLFVVTRELPLINMGELVKINIYMEIGDEWAYVAQGAKKQPVATVAASRGPEDASYVDEGTQAIPAPIHAPPPPPPAAGKTMP